MSEVFLGKVTGGNLMVIDNNDDGKINEDDSFFIKKNPEKNDPVSDDDLTYAFNECAITGVEDGTSIDALKTYIVDINAAKDDTYREEPSFKNVKEHIASAREKADETGIRTNGGVINHLLKYSASKTITNGLYKAYVSARKGDMGNMRGSLDAVAEASTFLGTNYDLIVARIINIGCHIYVANNGNAATASCEVPTAKIASTE